MVRFIAAQVSRCPARWPKTQSVRITSTVPLSQWPEEDGQANFDILGAAYANTSDGIVVFIDNEWTLFEKREISK